MMNKTAIVFGATGLVGSELLNVLIRDVRYRAVKVFTRNELYIEHIKVIEKIVDVEDVDSYSDMLKGDDLYICLGTTRRKAGSVAKMEDIDRWLPVRIAKASLRMGVQNVALVSSIGARASSRNYYYRIKGRMEEDILELEFKRKVILRPSILLGKRSEFRLFESLGKSMVKALGFMLRGQREKYRGIKASIVAEAMVKELNNLNGKTIYESDEIADINSTIH